MAIVGDGLHVQLEIGDAPKAADNLRSSVVIYAAKLPDGDIGIEEVTMLINPLREMEAGNFLFALDNELNIHRKSPVVCCEKGIDCHQTGADMPFVIRCAASITNVAINPQRPRIAVPQLEWLRRLYIVVVIEEHGWLIGSR